MLRHSFSTRQTPSVIAARCHLPQRGRLSGSLREGAVAAGEVYVCENAAYHPYSEDEAAKVLAEHDVLVKVDMGTGDASAKAWGCDLTYDYVKINGDYRT